MPKPQASKLLLTNKQIHIKNVLFFVMSNVIFAFLTSNISAFRQNFKNLVGNLLYKGSGYPRAKD